jgi:CubicO group peptidase (beta-lactamase class C family)
MRASHIQIILTLILCIIFNISATADLQPQNGQNLLDASIEAALKEEGLTGAAWATRDVNGHVVFGQAGYRDAENKLSFLADSKFHVGSVTKTLLATGILRLVSTGAIKLDYPVSFYLPGLTFDNPWAADKPVSVRHLLDHTSGLDDARLWQMFSTRIQADTPLIEAFTRQADVLRVRARPGERLSYSNMGYGLLGLVIESVTGESYESYLDREFLGPLGMHDSSFAFTTQEGNKADERLAWGHIDDGSRYAAAPIMLRPAGQFTTTSTDWMRFLIFLMGDGTLDGAEFIDNELMRARGIASTTQASHAGLEAGYALGLGRWDRYASVGLCHSGNIIGFTALMCIYPDTGQAFLISINTDSETADYKRIYRIIAGTLNLAAPGAPETRLPALDVSDWQGLFVLQPNRFESFRYLDTVFGFAKLDWQDGSLQFDPLQGKTRELRPTADYLLSADDRQVNSHVLLRDEHDTPLISDGYRTYQQVNPAVIYGLWFSLGLGLCGMLWFLIAGGIAIKRQGKTGFTTPQGIAMIGVLGLLLPIPLFFTQSFMALGDKTTASLLLAGASVFLPLTMLLAHGKIVRNKDRKRIDTLHGIAAVAVLQWCGILIYFGMLPLRLWA